MTSDQEFGALDCVVKWPTIVPYFLWGRSKRGMIARFGPLPRESGWSGALTSTTTAVITDSLKMHQEASEILPTL
jgi:hypothetical protein